MEEPGCSNEPTSPARSGRRKRSHHSPGKHPKQVEIKKEGEKKKKKKVVVKKQKKMSKCCGDIGCTRYCLGKISKSVRTKLNFRVQADMEKDPLLAHKFVCQFMSGVEISNFGVKSKHRKKVQWAYFIPAFMPQLAADFDVQCEDIERVEVCQIAFMEVFGVNERFIRNARDDQSKLLRGEEVTARKVRRYRKKAKKAPEAKGAEGTKGTAASADSDDMAGMWQLKGMYNWEQFEITNATLQGLVKEGFSSLLSISSIREEDLKYLKEATGIKQGQIALLRQAVAAISSTTISTCKALVQAISDQQMQDQQTTIEVTFPGGGEVGAMVETPGENEASTSGSSMPVLECHDGSPSPEASTSGVKLIPCNMNIRCDSPSSDSS